MKPLNQIQKRLQIVKTAISLTDEETINMQLSKLRLYKNDKQLENILSVLDDENYVQASNLIDRYIHGPYNETEEIDASTETETSEPEMVALPEENGEETAPSKEEEELFEQYGSSMEETHEAENQDSDEEEILVSDEADTPYTPPSREDEPTVTREQPSAEEIITRYEDIDEEHIPQSNRMAYTPPVQRTQTDTEDKAASPAEIENEEEDAFFDIDEVSSVQGSTPSSEAEISPKEEREETATESTHFTDEITNTEAENTEETESDSEEKHTQTIETIEYAPISYIDQKYRNMRNQYPQVEESSERFESEEKLLYLISLEGYTEADIEETIDNVYRLKGEGKLAEAAHLLLIAAATESIYAQYILARELFKGQILQRDLPEAFTQINRLAMNDYPEAVCDLAQFYEHGIGIDKDKRKAFELYEDALELGVERAEAHLNRMEEESKGIFGKLLDKLTGKK